MTTMVYNNLECIFNEELPEGSITYYGEGYSCMRFDDDKQAEGFLAVLLKDAQVNRESLIAFLDKMKVSFTAVETTTQLITKADAVLFQSNYPPEWKVGLKLIKGEVLKYLNVWYEVLQAHTSQSDWTPDKTPALFVIPARPGEIPEWVQPTGAHDAYVKGAKVIFEKAVYESLIDANVWSPKIYSQGWKKLYDL